MPINPLLAHQARQNIGNDAVGVDKVSGGGCVHAVTAAGVAVSVQQKGIGQAILGDEGFHGRITFLHTHGEDDEAIIPVLIVGCPKLGSAGVANRSPGVHEGNGNRTAAIIAQFEQFAIFTGQFKIRGQGAYLWRGS